ncbi:hypothetical protein MMC25_007012 [Agyrium rufum]|nr:hypothetical protein [Agyrium rufum]
MSKTQPPLSSILPPLICGSATFNILYNPDLSLIPAHSIVERALALGVRAFDTSPYYGPSESILGDALAKPSVRQNFPREEYMILTKVGRIAAHEFDYSKEWVRKSVRGSLERLKTGYLDVVYCHDVEFVSAEEVLEAVRELRRIRDEEGGVIKYVGISGYPVPVLCSLAEMILRETGEPLDAVMSYANYTIQNTTLASIGIQRLKAAGVDVVPNASVLGMGLLRRVGVPVGALGQWHPAPEALRSAVHEASEWCDARGETLEKVAIRYSVENWMNEGAEVGSRGDPASGVPWKRESIEELSVPKLGVSVMGVSNLEELDETMRVWRSILDGLEESGERTAMESGRGKEKREWSLRRKGRVLELVEGVRKVLGEWTDFAWDSPDRAYLDTREEKRNCKLRKEEGLAADSPERSTGEGVVSGKTSSTSGQSTQTSTTKSTLHLTPGTVADTHMNGEGGQHIRGKL